MKVLLTGSNGFIGGHTCKWLRQKGVYVIGTGRHQESLAECDEYVTCDLFTSDVGTLLDKTKAGTVDAVIHFAADMRHEPYTVEVTANNCVGTQRLLEMCESRKIPAFIQLSSLPVIGYPVQHPITEHHPLHPPTVYHVTKHTQELLAEYANYTFGLRTVSFRICSPVGKGVNPRTIFPTFVRKALAGEDITLSGKGTRKQTYIHVNDISNAVYLALTTGAQGVFNLASHNLISNHDLAKKIISVLHSDSQIVFSGAEDPMDEWVWDIDISKLTQATGFQPQIGIDECILDLAKSFS
ncbi:MAG: NAD(P)-dependent oxidoreductase [Clostridia bacterium]|nr:NAD(P)-dependent oxidoreductase [Clostridia bacterium]